LDINLIQNDSYTFLAKLSDFRLVWADTGEKTITDDAQICFNDLPQRIKDLKNSWNTIGADFDIRFNDLLTNCIQEVSGWSELYKLLGMQKGDLFYFVNSLYSFFPIWTFSIL